MSAEGQAPHRPTAQRLPSGRHQLAEEEVREIQRTRLIDATAELCAERGYANVVISDIVARAAVSKSTFYCFYETKEACLFDAHKRLSAQLLAALDVGASGYSSEAERLRAMIRSALEFAATHPEAAQLLTTGILSAGPEGAGRYRTAIEAISQRLCPSREGAEPRHSEALAAAIFAAPTITASLQNGDPAAALSLEDEFVAIALSYARLS